jgi:hypothetical protein
MTPQQANPLMADFPVITEKGEPKAVIVDVKVFRQLQVIMDNLIDRETEPEEALLAASEAFQRLLSQVEAEGETPSTNWREELRGL